MSRVTVAASLAAMLVEDMKASLLGPSACSARLRAKRSHAGVGGLRPSRGEFRRDGG
jgi:hypothetical protein